VVVALFDHGREGYLAAPIARDVMKAYFDKKARIEALRQQQTSVTARLSEITHLGISDPSSSPLRLITDMTRYLSARDWIGPCCSSRWRCAASGFCKFTVHAR